MQAVSDALALLTLTLRDVAELLGTSYNTVRSWRLGNRNPSPQVEQRLAKALRKHAQRLLKLADRLDREAERRSR